MPFDAEGARSEGYSDEEIAQYLSSKRKDFDVRGALKEGYSLQEIASHLDSIQVKKPAASISSLLSSVAKTGFEAATFPSKILLAGNIPEARVPGTLEAVQTALKERPELEPLPDVPSLPTGTPAQMGIKAGLQTAAFPIRAGATLQALGGIAQEKAYPYLQSKGFPQPLALGGSVLAGALADPITYLGTLDMAAGASVRMATRQSMKIAEQSRIAAAQARIARKSAELEPLIQTFGERVSGSAGPTRFVEKKIPAGEPREITLRTQEGPAVPQYLPHTTDVTAIKPSFQRIQSKGQIFDVPRPSKKIIGVEEIRPSIGKTRFEKATLLPEETGILVPEETTRGQLPTASELAIQKTVRPPELILPKGYKPLQNIPEPVVKEANLSRPERIAKNIFGKPDFKTEDPKLLDRNRVNLQFEKTPGPLTEQGQDMNRAELLAKKASQRDALEARSFGFNPGTKESATIQLLFGEKLVSREAAVAKYGEAAVKRMEKADVYFRSRYDAMITSRNELESARGLPLTRKKPDYYTHFREMGWIDELGLSEDPLGQVKAQKALQHAQLPLTFMERFKNVIFPFRRRIEGAYTADAIGGFERYSRYFHRSIHMTPFVDELNATSEAIGKTHPHLATFLSKQVDAISGHLTSLDVGVRSSIGNRVVDAANHLTRNFINAVITLNPHVVGMQFLRTGPLLAEHGIKRTILSAFDQFFNPELRSMALKSNVVQSLIVNNLERELSSGRLTNLARQAMPVYLVDREFAINGWISAYSKAIKAASHEQALRIADSLAGKIQSVNLQSNIPLLLRGQVSNIIFPLQKEANTMAQYVWRDVLGSGFGPETAYKVTTFTLGTTIAAGITYGTNVVMNKRNLTPFGPKHFIPGMQVFLDVGGGLKDIWQVAENLFTGNLKKAAKETPYAAAILTGIPGSVTALNLYKNYSRKR